MIRPGSPVKPCSKNSRFSARTFHSYQEIQTSLRAASRSPLCAARSLANSTSDSGQASAGGMVPDSDSFTATFAYDGGRIDGYISRNMLKAYTSANTRFMGPTWESFRIDSASLYLREEGPGTRTVEVKMAFAGYGQPLFGNYGWYALDSNFNFEKALLDDLQARARQAGEADLDRGIRQISEAPEPATNAPQPQLAITSEPSGAEIEINGEFIGNTPTTVTAKEGSVTVVVKKAGYQPWQRTLKLSSGDKRTLQADLIK